jgi:cysteine-S-conjugate beta-lyase
MGHPFDALTLEELRRRRSEKWSFYPPDILPVWVAEMDFPVAEPIRAALADLVDRSDAGYAYARGPELPESFAAFASARYGLETDPSRMFVLEDIMRGILVSALLFTEPGGGIAITPPVYPPFFSTIRYSGRRVVEAPLFRDPRSGVYGFDLDVLERAFRDEGARAFLLCNPHNPTGRVFSKEELESVATLADRYGVTVFADEVHAPMTYAGSKHTPFMSIDADSARQSVTMVSASKAWNLPGLKCAMVVTGSAERWDRLATLPDEVRYGAGITGLVANEAAFREGTPWLDDTIGYLESNVYRVADLLRERLPGVRWVPPEATYLGWLDCSALGLGDDPAAAFEERGRVALTHGPPFGTGGDGFARLNLGTTRAILEEAIERMARVLES